MEFSPAMSDEAYKHALRQNLYQAHSSEGSEANAILSRMVSEGEEAEDVINEGTY